MREESDEKGADVPDEVTEGTSHAGTSRKWFPAVRKRYDVGSQPLNTLIPIFLMILKDSMLNK